MSKNHEGARQFQSKNRDKKLRSAEVEPPLALASTTLILCTASSKTCLEEFSKNLLKLMRPLRTYFES